MNKNALKITSVTAGIAIVAGLAVSASAFSGHWRGGKMMRYMDVNGDGKITRQEVMPKLSRKFDKVDANADGKVTKQEIGEHVRKRVVRKVEHIFARFDADGDGMMTKAELEAHVDQHFKKIDANGDGEISRDEVRSFRRAMRDHMLKFFDKEH